MFKLTCNFSTHLKFYIYVYWCKKTNAYIASTIYRLLWDNRKGIYCSLSWIPDTEPPNPIISYVIRARNIFCSNIWSLTLVPDTYFLTPLEFSFVLMRQLWAPRWRVVTRKTKPWLEAWDFQAPSPQSPEKREGWKWSS